MNRVYLIILALILGIIVLTIFFPMEPQGYQEGFFYTNETSSGCREACKGNAYKAYCNSPYLSGGPAAPCKCQWDGGKCASTALLPELPSERQIASDQPSIPGIYWM